MIEQTMSICYIVNEGRERNSAPRRENQTGSYTRDFSFTTPIRQSDPQLSAAVGWYKRSLVATRNRGHGFLQFAAKACSRTDLPAFRRIAAPPTKNNPPPANTPFVWDLIKELKSLGSRASGEWPCRPGQLRRSRGTIIRRVLPIRDAERRPG